MRGVASHLLAKIGHGIAKLATRLFFNLGGVDAKPLAEEGRGFLSGADLTDETPTNDRNVEIVDEHPLLGLSRHVAAVELVAKEIVERAGNFGPDLAPDRMAIDSKTAVVHRPDQCIAGR
jgi:hypothetical protein